MKSIKRLPGGVMRTLGEELLYKRRALVAGNAFCEGAWPSLQAAQTDLAQALKQQETVATLEALTVAIREVDGSHDRLVHLIHMGLEVGILLAQHQGDEADMLLLQTCMDALLPDGKRQTTKPFHQEAGEAAIFVSRLTEAQVERLSRLMIAGVSVMALVREWAGTAERLGGLLSRRSDALKASDDLLNLSDVRRTWGHQFATFLGALSLSGLSQESQGQILGMFEEAVRMHRLRVARRSKTAGGEDDPAGDAPLLDDAVAIPPAAPEAPQSSNGV